MIRPKGVTTNYFLISLIPLWLSPVNRPHRAEREKKAGTRAPPPKKVVGWHVTPIAVLSHLPLSGPMRGRSRPYLSLREGSEQPPGGSAERSDTDL